MTNESTSERDTELRRLLVARVAERRSPRRRATTVAAALGSLAVVSTLAVVAVLTANPLPIGEIGEGGNEDYAFGTPSFVYDTATIIGDPVEFRSHESQVVDLGAAPMGATALGLGLRCFTAGTYSVTALDGLPPAFGPLTCDDDGTVASGGLGGYIPFSSSGATRIEISASPGGEYAVWLAWIAKPLEPEPSAEQTAALADGVVSREEYVAGFDRYAACMAAAGFTVGGNRESEIIAYSLSSEAVSSGADDQCYGFEFGQLDMEWQLAHPQTSPWQKAALGDGVVTREEYLDAYDRFVACMERLGYTVHGGDPQSEVLSYTIESAQGSAGASDYCYQYEFHDVDVAWQVSVEG